VNGIDEFKMKQALEGVFGEVFNEDHTKATPARFAKALQELTSPEEFNYTLFPATSDEMVVQCNIPFVSLCAHHLLPFRGVAHIAYVPIDSIIGLSKLARCVQYYAKGLQVQEDLTGQIADKLERVLEPLGVAVMLTGEHMCMTLRGIEAAGTLTTTSKMTGVFANHSRLARQEFLNIVQMNKTP